MYNYTPLGSHPEVQDKTPSWVWKYLLIIYGISAILNLLSEHSSGIAEVIFGIFLALNLNYNWKQLSKTSRIIIISFTLFSVLIGLYEILKP